MKHITSSPFIAARSKRKWWEFPETRSDLILESSLGPVVEHCREWVDDGKIYDRCGKRADVILWGKLFPAEAMGPRCQFHAEGHLGDTLDVRLRQGWAIFDLRGLVRR